jgi:hypothetical protein
LFPKSWREAYPKEMVATYDTGGWQAQTPIASGVDEELMNRLKALGYVK